MRQIHATSIAIALHPIDHSSCTPQHHQDPMPVRVTLQHVRHGLGSVIAHVFFLIQQQADLERSSTAATTRSTREYDDFPYQSDRAVFTLSQGNLFVFLLVLLPCRCPIIFTFTSWTNGTLSLELASWDQNKLFVSHLHHGWMEHCRWKNWYQGTSTVPNQTKLFVVPFVRLCVSDCRYKSTRFALSWFSFCSCHEQAKD